MNICTYFHYFTGISTVSHLLHVHFTIHFNASINSYLSFLLHYGKLVDVKLKIVLERIDISVLKKTIFDEISQAQREKKRYFRVLLDRSSLKAITFRNSSLSGNVEYNCKYHDHDIVLSERCNTFIK